MQRFALEARTVGSLNHPNIVALYDVGQEDGQSYVVSELLEGADAPRSSGRRATSGPQGDRVRRADGPRLGRSPRQGRRAPGPETRKRLRDQRGACQDPRLRPRAAGPVDTPRTRPQTTFAAVVPGKTEPGTVLGTVGYTSPEQVRGQVVGLPGRRVLVRRHPPRDAGPADVRFNRATQRSKPCTRSSRRTLPSSRPPCGKSAGRARTGREPMPREESKRALPDGARPRLRVGDVVRIPYRARTDAGCLAARLAWTLDRASRGRRRPGGSGDPLAVESA